MAAIIRPELRTNIRQRADMENTSFITDGFLNARINSAIEDLYDMVVAAFQDHYLTSVDFFLQGGTEANARYLMSTAFKYMRRLVKEPTSPDRIVCTRWELGNVYRRECPAYRLMGSYVVIEPFEDANGTYRLWYIPGAPLLNDDVTQLSGLIDQWADFIEMRGAIDCRVREETDTSDLRADLAGAEKRIKEMAANRDQASAPVTNEVIEEWNYTSGGGGGGGGGPS